MPRTRPTPAILEAIDELPGDREWWQDDNRRTFERVAGEMLDCGADENQIIEWLQALFGAAAVEFGE